MFISKLILFIVFLTNLCNSFCEISDKRLCVDDKCSVPVSLAKTLLRYSSPEPEGLSFAPNQEVVIFSKEAGSVATLWGAEINGKRGYIPKHLVREYRVLKKPTKLVATRIFEEPQVPNTSVNDVKPDKPLKPYEIIDGTKFYISQSEEKTDSQDTISTSEVLDKLPEEESSNIVTSKVVDEPSEQEAPNIVNEEIKDDVNYSSLVGSDMQNIKPTFEESDTSPFTPYSLNIGEKVLDNIQSSSDQPKPSSPKQTSSTNEETSFSGMLSSGNQSPVEEKSLNKEKLSSDKNIGVEEDVPIQEESLPSEDNTDQPTVEVPLLSNETSGSEPTSSNEPDKYTTAGSISAQEISETSIQDSQSAATELETNLTEIETSSLVNNSGFGESESDGDSLTKQNSNSEPLPIDLNVSIDEKNIIEQEKSTDNYEEDTSSSVNSWPPTNNLTYDVKSEMSGSLNEIKDPSPDANLKASEIMNNKIDLEVQADNVENTPPPTLLPIFPPFPGSLNNLATPAPSGQTSEEMVMKDTEIDENELAEELNNNSPSFLDNESKENESGESFDSNQQETFLPKADLSQPFEEKTIIQQSQSAAVNQGYLSSNINDLNNNNDQKINGYNEESTQQPLDSDNTQEEPNVEDVIVPEQRIFADDTVTVKNNVAPNEYIEQTQFEQSPNQEESTGLFSMLTSFFDWSSTSEKVNENSEIDKIDERNLKCDANIDQFSFSLNSNLMMHLITTVVVFVTFLIFYLSVNKHRVESPLVAKINQLEKDLLIMIKERETLGEKGISDFRNEFINSDELIELNQKLGQVCSEKEDLEVQLNAFREELEKKDNQIENLEKELETSTEVGLELNKLISEVLDPSTNGSEKLKENVEQFQKQLQEQTEVIKSMSTRLKAKEAENVELLLEVEESKKNAASIQEGIKELVEKVTTIEREKDAQQNVLQNEIKVYQNNYNEIFAKNQLLDNEIQILKTKIANNEREIDLKIKECNSLKESFKDINSMKNDNKKLISVLDTISMRAEYEQMKSDLEKYVRELQQNQSEKAIIENKYENILQEITDLKTKYQEIDKDKLETDMKLEVLNNYFKKREMELQEEVLKYKSIWDAKQGEATSTTERIKLLQEEIENYKTQNEALKQEIVSQEIALKSQITLLEKKAHENWVSARQSERKLEDARQEAAQLRNRLTFRQRSINDEMMQNGLDQNDTTMSSQPSMYSPASPPLFYDNGRDQVTKSPIPGLPPFLPPPPGAPFVPPPVPNLSGMPLPPPFMPPLPAGFPGDHRPPPLGRMSSPPIKSRYSPDASAFSPYDRGSPSPIYDSEYGSGPYRNYSPYHSEDDRRGYRNRSPSPVPRTKTRPSKSSLTTPNVKRSNDSLDKTNSKKSNMV